jgi:integrase
VRAQKPKGSVVFNRTRSTWNFLWVENGSRRSRKLGTLTELPTRSDALRKAEAVRRKLRLVAGRTAVSIKQLVEQYRAERMPMRSDTRRAYEVWLKNHILPRWGDCELSELQARVVELWIGSLPLAPKSKVHIRGVISILWDYAMWRGDAPTQRNPMELVRIKSGTKRMRKPRSLTVEEFQGFVQHLEEPFCTIALLCVCFGLRISECLALRWSDVDWLNAKLSIQRSIVCQKVDEVKTQESQRAFHITNSMLETLKLWKQTTQFSGSDDWMFASPIQLGRLPWSYDQIWRVYQKAADKAAIGRLGTHSLRHTYRSWLDSVGAPVGVQQKLMRHSDVRTTMNIYGDAATEEMRSAHEKVVRLAMPRA